MVRRAGLALILAATLALTACGATYRNHGYVPEDSDLAALTVGVDTRETVAAAVGRPSSRGILDASGWYYVQSRWRNFAYRAPQEIDREVVAISFDERGTVSNVERFGLDDGRVVPLSRRVTTSNVQGVSFLRQLFGNLGNLDIGEFLN
ncbi:outer membrane protein assembly factor BamE [Rhodobacteraceae bacterium CCMM004]|nr:outer membrane protein assembly factor BamE [Rhodobacteraceae bacterium CCMM004]